MIMFDEMFQRPKRASFISTRTTKARQVAKTMFQRPKRASFISTKTTEGGSKMKKVSTP